MLAAASLFFFCGRRSRPRAEKQATTPSQQPTGPAVYPPAYVPPGSNFGYMSPAHKHMSVTSAPVTDAFGNPIPNGGMYGYPNTYQQAYPPPQMQQVNMGQPQPSPSTEIFGSAAPTPQQMQEPQRSEDHFMRASSPSSVQANPTTVGGIEAFLQRQGRISPSPEPENTQALLHSPPIGPGPYEMSTSPTHYRR